MDTPNRSPRPEPVAKSGEVLLSANHIALLHGLCDRPDGQASSTADLVRAALPYVALFRDGPSQWCLRRSTHTLHPMWAEHWRLGGRIAWQLTERGRAILDRTVPARIRGLGPYRGLRPVRERASLQRRPRALEARWTAALEEPAFKLLAAAAERLVTAWCRRHGPRSFNEALRFEYLKSTLVAHVRAFVLHHRALPSGTAEVGPGRTHVLVDFDALRESVSIPPDVAVERRGAVALIRPLSAGTAARLREFARDDARWRDGALVCDPLLVDPIIDALRHRDDRGS